MLTSENPASRYFGGDLDAPMFVNGAGEPFPILLSHLCVAGQILLSRDYLGPGNDERPVDFPGNVAL